MLITYGMAKCSICGCDVPYFGRHLFGVLKDNKLYCYNCDIKEGTTLKKK